MKICIVSPESSSTLVDYDFKCVFPAIAASYCSHEADTSVLWSGYSPGKAKFRAEFPGCSLYRVSDWASRDVHDNQFWPAEDEALNPDHWTALQIARSLRALEQAGTYFDVIEFPDWTGVALPTLQEKRLGRFLRSSEIAVRLYGTEAERTNYAGYKPSRRNLIVRDLERKALSEADIVIGSAAPVVTAVHDRLGLSEDWLDRVTINAVPIEPVLPTPSNTTPFDNSSSVVFPSPIDPAERPLEFVQGLSVYMNANPDFKGDVFLSGPVLDEELLAKCKSHVPEGLKSRFHFVDYENPLRNKMIEQSIAVFPAFRPSMRSEALFASTLGATVIANSNCPGFAAGSGWSDGTNFVGFDGTPRDLSRAVGDVVDNKVRTQPILISKDRTPYWLELPSDGSKLSGLPTANEDLKPPVSAVIALSEADQDWRETVSSLKVLDLPELEIIIVGHYNMRSLTDMIEATLPQKLYSIRTLDYISELAGLYNEGLSVVRHDLVVLARAGIVFDAGFLSATLSNLTSDSSISFAVPQTRYRSQDQGDRIDSFAIGEAWESAAIGNHFGGAEVVGRRQSLLEVGFDEDLDRFEDLDFFMRAAALGHRVLATNVVGAGAPEPAKNDHPHRTHLDSILVKFPLAGRGLSLVTPADVVAGGTRKRRR